MRRCWTDGDGRCMYRRENSDVGVVFVEALSYVTNIVRVAHAQGARGTLSLAKDSASAGRDSAFCACSPSLWLAERTKNS